MYQYVSLAECIWRQHDDLEENIAVVKKDIKDTYRITALALMRLPLVCW